eukprot:CAMPEP_0184652294 /NCGR_PEP_ID=MMETSP0308-20130426/9993_1 /TAXON_ID=38269 /ORGANISM="Gloeochaete witrockiana, Strain SAG 46.84" /LENGTH=190 /DNA_ID=CAMNT_0027087093 /DNA_START=148 /DNA_END=720 /DNA_ORIENTATION=-
MTSILRSECTYTASFCEENVWHLCRWRFGESDLKNLYVIFISNYQKAVPVWVQRASSPKKPVFWDYHVIAVHEQRPNESLVYDLDTRLDFPVSFETYVTVAIRPDVPYDRQFRVVPALEYLAHFSSDRSHMMKDGKWLSPPPPSPCIVVPGCTSNLNEYIDMSTSSGPGKVLDLRMLMHRFGKQLVPVPM